MKTKIFLPAVAMLSLMLFSFTANANSYNNSLLENTFFSQETESFESAIFQNPVENMSELSLEEELRIRIRIRLRRVEIIIDIQFSMAGGSGGSDDGGAIADSQLEGEVDGNNLVVRGFQARNGSIIDIRENQMFETESGVYEIAPGSYEINDGKVVFNVEQSRG